MSKIYTHCQFALFSLIAAAQSSCTYRLANSELKAPKGLNKIYVEAVFDTSSKSLPHDLLWNELQRAVIDSGKVRLASRLDADAHLRTHITAATLIQMDPIDKDKKFREDPVYQGGLPAPYRDYKDLNTAIKYANKETISISVDVELIDRRNGKAIFRKNYPIARTYPILNTGNVEAGNRYQRAEEAFESNFQQGSKSISVQILSDILSL